MGRGKPPNALRAKGVEKEEEEEYLMIPSQLHMSHSIKLQNYYLVGMQNKALLPQDFPARTKNNCDKSQSE
jgi:hypothetical protein